MATHWLLMYNRAASASATDVRSYAEFEFPSRKKGPYRQHLNVKELSFTNFSHAGLSTRMRLRALLNDESKQILKALEDCNIRTDEQFLYNSDSLLALFQKLPPNVVAFSDLERLQEKILRFLSTDGRSGVQLFEERPEEGLQNWSTVTGRKGSGKTSLVLNIALSYLASTEDCIVHWVDTTGDFSAERASQILEAAVRARPHSSNGPRACNSAVDCRAFLQPDLNQSPVKLLERLRVSLSFKADSAYAGLTEALAASRSDSTRRLGMVVIDAITPLFAPLLAAGSSEGHATMSTFTRLLHEISMCQNVPVLITNTATSGPHPVTGSSKPAIQSKPSLGPTFTYLTDTTLWLSRAKDAVPASYQCLDAQTREDVETYIAEILRSRNLGHLWWCLSLHGGVLRDLPANNDL